MKVVNLTVFTVYVTGLPFISGTNIPWIRVTISTSMIIRGNGTTCAPMIPVTWDPFVTTPVDVRAILTDMTLDYNRRLSSMITTKPATTEHIDHRWHCNACIRHAVENKRNSGPVDVGVMPVGTVRSKMA